MTESYPWYGLAEDDDLQQGDIFSNCPHFRITDGHDVRQQSRNVVVLSQSCDLAQGKLEVVQVCPFWPLEHVALEVEFFKSRRGREELRRGHVTGYHLINRCELDGFETDFLVCDFRSLFGVSFDMLKDLATEQSPHLRLLPPYREHLAQSFARFFMRVGLPVDVPPFR